MQWVGRAQREQKAESHDGKSGPQEEVAGPMLSMARFTTGEEGIEMRNNNRYGLATFMSTSDIEQAHCVIGQLAAGYVSVRDFAGLTRGSPVRRNKGERLRPRRRPSRHRGILAAMKCVREIPCVNQLKLLATEQR
jgi:hypothetical protein